ncbi:ATPase, T2SS/T4P/T4SS family [Undibacterium sp. RTI2.1]|uniref:GspE/PulE family protein n=1 Tax=unclassified Undibacterium TaxID=2630295 RepID=UPI002AB51980|nr:MULTISPECIES: ATPase, T2SS/T4P/T4SS family [unclassified Undibacterium]MDY7539947.1 ATPase, T2SS/T4P/T4SS family [Undibacterium sp. 5I1]MEB0032804.1 ATPase, T2SS/T4P/T4SS family [Undibacterium sp. RTI2.1]MEB0116458.1 ATPase, T2SS/T4P/T4SS family [Undibacterium sp. RTI2.2]MEB0230554.1 ATPase, T2SS/T4P/T4SS family [Undibacterium sp. 10I3]MEB0257252.1 ATPase, T2SS/T4P/T4SS family [Undibacterium sp. 5I1]
MSITLAPIGTLLVAKNLVTEQDVDRALQLQTQLGAKLGQILIRIGAISEDNLLPVLAQQLDMPLLDEILLPTTATVVEDAAHLGQLSIDWLLEQETVIWENAEGVIECASPHPLNSFARETLANAFNHHTLHWSFIRSRDVERIRNMLRSDAISTAFSDEVAHLRELAEEAPVIELVNNTWGQAIDIGASDIHIEPEEHGFEIRFRVDGILSTKMAFGRDRFDAVVSRIKLISGLDIAERRLPQDGRISIRASGIDIDIRVSVIPGVHGESIVLRLLPKERKDFSLKRLGMEEDHLSKFRQWIKEPHGIVLVTGPTGSGKSTSLYAALAEANDRQKKIITVEDPVEYKMDGITQIQTHADIDYTFSRALRAILRHDPDIIMIGEIRDLETAEIAVQSALTGHMVFSTLHTNDAIGAFNRLIDMGLEPFLVASSLRAVQAQRLVRRLCSHCAKPVSDEEMLQLAPAEFRSQLSDLSERFPDLLSATARWHHAVGCPQCQQTGYRGRVGIYEFVEVTTELQAAIVQRMPAHEINLLARKNGYRNLREDGFVKARNGMTTIDEVMRVTGLSNQVVA